MAGSSLNRALHLPDEFRPLPKKIVSNADLYIKELAKKQQNTVIDLHCELANPKEFCKGAELISLSSFNAGTSSLEEFQEATTHIDHIAHLKAAGLVEYEIKLYLDYLKGECYLLNKHKNSEESTLMKTVDRIKDCVRKYQENQSNPILFKDAKLGLVESERLDNGLSVKPNSNETKLYKFALENERLRKKSGVPSPMDDIKQIEKSFLKSLNVPQLPTINKIRRKARKLVNRVHRIGETHSCPIRCKQLETFNENNHGIKSKWDEKTETTTQNTTKPKQLYTCSPQNYYTIKDGTIVKLNKAECQARDLPFTKLTMDEIKQMPKFQDYEEGIPSKVLYLRNLSNTIKEIDLKLLFKDYDRNGEINYKIMKGKLRGQAFVTFPDEDVALQALNEVNGVFLKCKPVIIQFGRGKG